MDVTAKRVIVWVALSLSGTIALAAAQPTEEPSQKVRPPRDAVAEAQTPREVAVTRPEQDKTEHDRSTMFRASHALPSSPAFTQQPAEGQVRGFDFYRDPLNAEAPPGRGFRCRGK